ncbi:MAG: phosphohydrolase, partial [Elusimicrobiota bacterium]
PEIEVELAKISAYLHDVGNAVGQSDHQRTSAILAMNFLKKMKVPYTDIFKVMNAIGSHEDRDEDPPSAICAATIIGDKSDVHRSRVRKTDLTLFDTHDRVNYASTQSSVKVDEKNKIISLEITIDTKYCSVMEYFEIFISRTKFCKRAANYLGCQFELYINGDKML